MSHSIGVQDKVSYGTEVPAVWRGGCLCIGNFDGVHLGHRALLREVSRLAELAGVPALAMTFSPHPAEVLSGAKVQLLQPIEERVESLLDCGIDGVWVYPFSVDFASLEPIQFIHQFLVNKLDISQIVVGEDFRFGNKRKGTVDTLREAGHQSGFEVVTFSDVVSVGGEAVSSTRIRRHLSSGEVDLVGELLGQRFGIRGLVGHGEGLGQKLGFPTANLVMEPSQLIPGHGVYSGEVLLQFDADRHKALISVGNKPTLGDFDTELEVHILDFDQNIYQQEIKVYFTSKIREQKKFGNLDELVAAMRRDRDVARHGHSAPA